MGSFADSSRNDDEYEDLHEYNEPFDDDDDEEDDGDEEYNSFWTYFPVEAMRDRLETAILLSKHSVPTVVWGAEALMLVRSDNSLSFIPDLSILVEDHHLEAASQVIQRNLPYKLNPDIMSNMATYGRNGEETNCFPLTTRLTREEGVRRAFYNPVDVLIHPASFFQFDISDRSRSTSLEGLPEDVRFPTQAAWIDSMFDTIRNPYGGYMGHALYRSIVVWMMSLEEVALKQRPLVLEGGRFNDECLALMDGLKEENRHVMKNWLLGCRSQNICNIRLELDETGKRVRRFRMPVAQPSSPPLRPQPTAASGLLSKTQAEPSWSKIWDSQNQPGLIANLGAAIVTTASITCYSPTTLDPNNLLPDEAVGKATRAKPSNNSWPAVWKWVRNSLPTCKSIVYTSSLCLSLPVGLAGWRGKDLKDVGSLAFGSHPPATGKWIGGLEELGGTTRRMAYIQMLPQEIVDMIVDSVVELTLEPVTSKTRRIQAHETLPPRVIKALTALSSTSRLFRRRCLVHLFRRLNIYVDEAYDESAVEKVERTLSLFKTTPELAMFVKELKVEMDFGNISSDHPILEGPIAPAEWRVSSCRMEKRKAIQTSLTKVVAMLGKLDALELVHIPMPFPFSVDVNERVEELCSVGSREEGVAEGADEDDGCTMLAKLKALEDLQIPNSTTTLEYDGEGEELEIPWKLRSLNAASGLDVLGSELASLSGAYNRLTHLRLVIGTMESNSCAWNIIACARETLISVKLDYSPHATQPNLIFECFRESQESHRSLPNCPHLRDLSISILAQQESARLGYIPSIPHTIPGLLSSLIEGTNLSCLTSFSAIADVRISLDQLQAWPNVRFIEDRSLGWDQLDSNLADEERLPLLRKVDVRVNPELVVEDGVSGTVMPAWDCDEEVEEAVNESIAMEVEEAMWRCRARVRKPQRAASSSQPRRRDLGQALLPPVVRAWIPETRFARRLSDLRSQLGTSFSKLSNSTKNARNSRQHANRGFQQILTFQKRFGFEIWTAVRGGCSFHELESNEFPAPAISVLAQAYLAKRPLNTEPLSPPPLSSFTTSMPASPRELGEKPSNPSLEERKSLEGSFVGAPGFPSTLGVAPPVVQDEKALWRKVDRKLLPILAVMYLFSFMDRANIGNARLQGLEQDLNMSGDQYNLALVNAVLRRARPRYTSNADTLTNYSRTASLNFLQRKSDRRGEYSWLPLITVLWGSIMISMGFVKTFHQLLATRILLGAAEAGFYPGVVYYLSLWYPRYKLQTRVAAFFGAASMAGAFSGLLAYGIGHMHGLRGLGGWSWIFIIEGALTVFIGIIAYIVMVDLPSDASFLTPDERQFIRDSHKLHACSLGEEEHFEMRHVWEALTDWQLYLFIPLSIGFSTPLYGITFFAPTIINSFGYSPAVTQLLSIPPYIFGTICLYTFAYLSDKLRIRSSFLLVSLLISFTGYAINISSAPIQPRQFKRGIVIGLHVGSTNVGGAIGSVIFRRRDAPRYLLGNGLQLMFITLSAISVGIAVVAYRTINSRRDEAQRRQAESGIMISEEQRQERRKHGDKAVDFRYTL
ncbi:hypothetical protein NMY22_g9699 [Coprinellus aureogranulatus]|nr:hypothetical protein NMY22_g9699 [Coprinellus aureogranulatus]